MKLFYPAIKVIMATMTDKELCNNSCQKDGDLDIHGSDFTPGKVTGGLEGNIRGLETEQKVAGILENLSIVVGVLQVPQLSELDREMVDLVVTLNPGVISTDEVFVQVKASSRGVGHFKEELNSRLKRNNENPLSRAEWMLQNRMILIVGDTMRSKSGQTTWVLSDEEIVESFNKQLQEIESYQGNLDTDE